MLVLHSLGQLSPINMANLRGVLNVDFGIADDIASHISNIMWFIALLCTAAIGNETKIIRRGYLVTQYLVLPSLLPPRQPYRRTPAHVNTSSLS